MDAATNSKCTELMQEVITYFRSQFSLACFDVMVKKCEEESQSGSFAEEQQELEDAPTPFEPLKEGTMTKKAGFFILSANWKTRHFVAYNERDNFRIEYFEKVNGKSKGIVGPCGYSAMVFSEEDDKNEGTVKDKEFGVKLVPYNKDRRTWYFKCSSKDDQEKWLDVLRTCCWKAKPERNANTLIADAFDIAYWNTRWYYSLWGSYSPWGTENERLVDLVMSVIDREVLHSLIQEKTASLPPSMRANAESTIRSPLVLNVNSNISGQWVTMCGTADACFKSSSATVSSNIASIIEAKMKFKEQIVGLVNGIVQPILADKAGAVLKPVLSKACSPIGKAFAKFSISFNEKMTTRLGNGEFDGSKFDNSMRDVEYGMYWTMLSAYDIVYDMCFNGFFDIMPILGGVSLDSVYYMCRDSMNKIHYNAAYTFKKTVKESGNYDQPNLRSILQSTMRKMIHDCKLVAKDLIVTFLRLLLDVPVLELMIKPAKALVEPIQTEIDKVPLINSFLNLSDITSQVIEKIVRDCLLTVINQGFIATMESEFANIKI